MKIKLSELLEIVDDFTLIELKYMVETKSKYDESTFYKSKTVYTGEARETPFRFLKDKVSNITVFSGSMLIFLDVFLPEDMEKITL